VVLEEVLAIPALVLQVAAQQLLGKVVRVDLLREAAQIILARGAVAQVLLAEMPTQQIMTEAQAVLVQRLLSPARQSPMPVVVAAAQTSTAQVRRKVRAGREAVVRAA
jgi:hypothetical protein